MCVTHTPLNVGLEIIPWTHKTAFHSIRPLVCQDQYCLLKLAVALWGFRLRSFPITLLPDDEDWTWLGPSACKADTPQLSHGPSLIVLSETWKVDRMNNSPFLTLHPRLFNCNGILGAGFGGVFSESQVVTVTLNRRFLILFSLDLFFLPERTSHFLRPCKQKYYVKLPWVWPWALWCYKGLVLVDWSFRVFFKNVILH